MPVEDIRPIKAGMREHYKNLRRSLPDQQKAAMDAAVARRVAALWQYKHQDILLTYVSTPIEVDTTAIIRRALFPAVYHIPG